MATPLSSTLVESVPSWVSYLDLQNDVKPFMQFPPTDTASDVMLQDTIDTACYWVQDYLGRPVAPTQFFRRYSGWGVGAVINLPYYPILSITSVVEWWGANGPITLTEQIPSNQGSQQVYQLDAIHGQIIRSFTGLVARPFFPGLRNIEVNWTAGYNPIPRPIIMATRELIHWWWANTQQASRSFTPGAGQYGEQQGGQHPLWPAVPDRVTTLLQTFDQISMG